MRPREYSAAWDAAAWAALLAGLAAFTVWPWIVAAVITMCVLGLVALAGWNWWADRDERAARARRDANRAMFAPPPAKGSIDARIIRWTRIGNAITTAGILAVIACPLTVLAMALFPALCSWDTVGVAFAAAVTGAALLAAANVPRGVANRLTDARDADLRAVPVDQMRRVAYDLYRVWGRQTSAPADFAHPARIWIARGQDAALKWLNQRYPDGPRDDRAGSH